MTIDDGQPGSIFSEGKLPRSPVPDRRYCPAGAISGRTCYDSNQVSYLMSFKAVIDIVHWRPLQMAEPMASIVECGRPVFP